MDFNRFKTDASAENDGVWIDLGDGAKIKVARAGNRKNSDLFTRLTNGDPDYKRKEKLGTLTDAEYEPILLQVIADTILLDWEGFTEDGKPVPYSRENALRLLSFRDFRKAVQDASAEAANFRAQNVADATDALKKS